MNGEVVAPFELIAPSEVVAPVREVAPVAPRQTLPGIDWAEVAADARGEVAMFDVPVGEGRRQEWGRRA